MESGEDADLSQWKGAHWSLASPPWPGINGIKYLIIFGASYCQTSLDHQPAPTVEEPLGVPFPGFTYTEGPPNWVGHLAKSREPPFLVHNYSRGGQTVSGVKNQVALEFMQRHPPVVPWMSSDTIFATWVGINDLAYITDVQPTIDALFEAQQELYEKGARIFLFIDVFPPSPAYKSSGPKADLKFRSWNIALGKALQAFATEKSTTNEPITAIYFSSHKVLSTILDDPEGFGFPKADAKRAGGSIWEDRIHPMSAVHLIIARELLELLSNIPPYVSRSDGNNDE